MMTPIDRPGAAPSLFGSALASIAVGLVVGLIGSAILFHELWGQPITKTLWSGDLDPNIIVWTVEWSYQKIFVQLAPLDLWNANSYFPYRKSLAFSDSILSAQLLYAPLRAAGFEILPALYLTLVGFTLLGTIATDRLLQTYDFSMGERALVIVCAHFTLSMTGFLGHWQLFGMQLVPPLLLALHRLLNLSRGRDLVIITTLFCLAGGFSTYVVPMVGLLGILLFLVFLIPILRHMSIMEIGRRIGWQHFAISLVIFGLFFVIQLLPYLSLFGTLPRQPMEETYVYSARPWSIVFHVPLNSYWYPAFRVVYGHWERAAFPGIPLLLLAILGGLTILRSKPAARLEPYAAGPVPLSIYAVAVFFLCWVLSLGPYLKPFAGSEFKLPLPFLVLAKLLPGVENIRAPGRYAQLFGLPLGLMALIAARSISARTAVSSSVVATALAGVILIDQFPRMSISPFVVPHEAFFRAARPVIAVGEPIVQLPIAAADHLATYQRRTQQLVSSTVHLAKLVAGAGSRDTPEQDELVGIDNGIRKNERPLSDVAAFARRLGIKKIVVFPGDYPAEAQANVREQAGKLGKVLLSNPEGLVVSLE